MPRTDILTIAEVLLVALVVVWLVRRFRKSG
jgi:hypothetical protein